MEKLLQYKNPRLIKVLEIQDNYQKHKARLLRIQTTKNEKKNFVLQGVNSYRKSKYISDMFKAKNKRDKLAKQNTLIHDTLKKVYTRKDSATSARSLTKSYSERSLILTRRDLPSVERERKISVENLRLRNKLLSTKSSLNKKTLYSENKRNKTIEQERITTNANKRRQELAKLMLKQHHSKPVTYNLILPGIKKVYSTSIE